MRPLRKNLTIANVFSQMGIVEELGSGIKKMFKYTPLYANGKLPVIEENDIYRIEIPYVPTATTGETSQKGLQKTTQKILDMIQENPEINIEELAEACGLTRDGINYNIKKLKAKGRLRRIGPDKGGYWEVLTDDNH